eukprot:CAMPEP_0181305760 /NCGR_PEP_ID=MMETSP1101-20121128/9915_1 /TAXON_ID=46948 /ORGANISM="Rhodomonas abbreviata, Strain Caron Lab Isolate" /LENGTH=318 /DNA_ID=CAMNT_0023411725 /DNA_START=267 /DNA_END=1223 /DNA_ORIENTATION=+
MDASIVEEPETEGLGMPSLQSVKNVRDLASVQNSPIKPGRIFRAACVGTACETDAPAIVENFKTLIDLRSEKEWNGDVIKYNSTVFDQYDSLIYSVKKSKSGRPKLIVPSSTEVSVSGSSTLERPRTRHMLSVIDESIYKRGVFKRFGMRKKLKAAAYMGVNFPKAKRIFLDYINSAGLPLLNELILDYGGPAIKAVMEVLSEKDNLPVAFYCTAGKDRTGLVSMLVLSALGVSDEDIINDYVLSDTVYADLNDKSAMVGALQQEQLDPERFLRAPRSVMETTIALLRNDYGGAHAYLESIGFGPDKIERMRAALCED